MKTFKIPNEKLDVKNLKSLRTAGAITWCPGCPNQSIMESVRRAMISMINKGKRREDFVMVAGIGCHGKMFDYLNINGIYSLHGRAIPTALGIKLGNPNLKVFVIAGDGDTYSEGMSHFIEASRYNADFTLIVHDNQSFSLTTGQATPTSQIGYKTKAEPLGEFNRPFNPLKLALTAGCGFVARCNARDFQHTAQVIESAMNHRGFSFVEIIQDCMIFNLDMNDRDARMYKVPAKKLTLQEAMKLADEYDYNSSKGKIPIGIFYHDDNQKCLEDKWPQLRKLTKLGVGWKGLKSV